MSRSTVTSIGMIIVKQPDIAAAVTFYQQIGLRLTFHLKDAWAELTLGGIKIGLCPTSQPPHEYKTGIVLNVVDLHAFYQEHKDSLCFISEPKEAIHGIMIGVKDPGNNILDIYQPTPERVMAVAQKAAAEQQPRSGKSNFCQNNEKKANFDRSSQCCI